MTRECRKIRERLHDFADGGLGGADRRAVRGHLDGCSACRSELAALERLRAGAARLPREVRPPRDLWPAIESRLEPAAAANRWRRLARAARAALRAPAPLLAAGAAALALALGLSLWRTRPEPPAPALETASTRHDPALAERADLARFEDGTTLAHRDLLEALERRRGELPPETAALLEDNLRILDQAIGQIRSALEEDPLNPRLRLLLAAHYQHEVQLLKRVSRV